MRNTRLAGLLLAFTASFRFDPDRETDPMPSALSGITLRAMNTIFDVDLGSARVLSAI
jgi:hypothetical protein